MSTQIVELIVALVTVISSLAATLLLSFRVGRLVGKVEGFMASSASDRSALHSDIGKLDAEQAAHLAWHMGQGR